MNQMTPPPSLQSQISLLMLSLSLVAIDSSAGTWTFKEPLPTKRVYTATAVCNGQIYVLGGIGVGGVRLPTVVKYDPSSDSWGSANSMNIQRGYFAAETVNGRIYVFGGSTINALFDETATVEEYDPSTDKWTFRASMPAPRVGHASAVIDGKVYIIGGERGLSREKNTWEYDPISDSWSVKQDMPTPRVHIDAAVINGKIYVAGGVQTNVGLTNLELFDPQTNTWLIGAPMSTGRWYLGVAGLGGELYAMGGLVGPPGLTNLVEKYDPQSNSWSNETSLPETLSGYSDSAVAFGSFIYLFGGDNPTEILDYTLQFSPFVDDDQDGVPDNEDQCLDSDLLETVIIDSCDSQVENLLFENGCTIMDLVLSCADDATNHGQFVSCVTHLTNDLRNRGVIAGRERAAIQRCAAR